MTGDHRTSEASRSAARAQILVASGDSLPGHLNNALAVLTLGAHVPGTEPYPSDAVVYSASVIADVLARIRAALVLHTRPAVDVDAALSSIRVHHCGA